MEFLCHLGPIKFSLKVQSFPRALEKMFLDTFSMAEEGVVLVNFQEEEVYEEVFFHRHNRDKNCWTIPKEKAATFVGKVISTANIYKNNA